VVEPPVKPYIIWEKAARGLVQGLPIRSVTR
jgi:hypothetical protein